MTRNCDGEHGARKIATRNAEQRRVVQRGVSDKGHALPKAATSREVRSRAPSPSPSPSPGDGPWAPPVLERLPSARR